MENAMEGVTRRKALAMGAAPVFVGVGTYAAARWEAAARGGHARAGDAARALIQQRHLPNVPLVTHEGETVRFYDDLVRDKKVLVSFVSTAAAARSNTALHNLAVVKRFFGDRVGRDIFIHTISRTPDRDSIGVLRAWARRTGAGAGWRFMTGDPADVERVRHGLGFTSEDPAEDADPAYAVGLLRLGVEREMRWAHCQSLASPRVIAHAMLLDFGAASVDTTRITWSSGAAAGAPGSAPVWNCQLLLAGIR
jgi:protein SCO1